MGQGRGWFGDDACQMGETADNNGRIAPKKFVSYPLKVVYTFIIYYRFSPSRSGIASPLLPQVASLLIKADMERSGGIFL